MSSKQTPLVRWIWRSYFRTSLIPLLIVEVALIALYFISNAIANRENIEAMRMVAEQDVREVAQREAVGINRQLEGVARATEYLRQHTTQVMAGDKPFERDDPGRLSIPQMGRFIPPVIAAVLRCSIAAMILSVKRNVKKPIKAPGWTRPISVLKMRFR